MLHAYLTSRATRPIVAFLLAGSMMGFVLGQQIGHRPAQAHHTTSAVARQLASGSLGTRTLDQPVHTAPAQPHKHEKKHGGDGGDGHQGGDGQGSHGDGGKGGGGGGGGGGGDSVSSD